MDKFNPFTFKGRLGRLQYFGFSIIMGIILAIAFAIAGVGVDPETGSMDSGGALVTFLGLIVLAIASLSYGVRRFHDFDKSGWWYLLALIPFVNLVVALILLFAPPTPGPNRYGVR